MIQHDVVTAGFL